LFADGAGACVLGSVATGPEMPLYEVHAWKSHMISQIRHEIAPDASISKSESMPALVGSDMCQFMDSLLQESKVDMADCMILCHPASNHLLNNVEKRLGLASDQLSIAREVLREHGNISGASNLPMMDSFRGSDSQRKYQWGVCVAYGAGVGIEGCLVRPIGKGVKATALVRQPTLGTPVIFSLSSTYPEEQYEYDQKDVLKAFLQQLDLPEDDVAFAKTCYNGTMIDRRSLALPIDQLYAKPSSMAAQLRPKVNLSDQLYKMLVKAGEQAMSEWGGDRSQITHLITGSLTQVAEPGLDRVLAEKLNLSPSCERITIDHMGCLAGFRVVGLASHLAAVSSNHRILVVYGDVASYMGTTLPKKPNKLDIMSVSLFSDGAAGCVVGTVPRQHEPTLYEVHKVTSKLVAGSFKDMYMKVLVEGTVINVVSPRVPIFIGKHCDGFARLILKDTGIDMEKCAMLCHPGGKTILDTVEDKLGLVKQQINTSWEVLRAHGNMTGATNLQVADYFRRSDAYMKYEWATCVSFGPGLGMEGLLVRNPHYKATAVIEGIPRPITRPNDEAEEEEEIPLTADALKSHP